MSAQTLTGLKRRACAVESGRRTTTMKMTTREGRTQSRASDASYLKDFVTQHTTSTSLFTLTYTYTHTLNKLHHLPMGNHEGNVKHHGISHTFPFVLG